MKRLEDWLRTGALGRKGWRGYSVTAARREIRQAENREVFIEADILVALVARIAVE